MLQTEFWHRIFCAAAGYTDIGQGKMPDMRIVVESYPNF